MAHIVLFTVVWAFVFPTVFSVPIEDCGKICLSSPLQDITIYLFKRSQKK
jgi:hypothetical protein